MKTTNKIKELIKVIFFINLLVLVQSVQSQTWNQVGNNIDGEAAYDNSGVSISMSGANTIAIGATGNDGANGLDSGQVRVYELSGGTWTQKGADIDGEVEGDFFGESISMPNSITLAASSINSDVNGSDSGYVRVFEWNGNNWIQRGQNIYGDSDGFLLGLYLSMPNINTLAIGMAGGSAFKGLVRVYQWDGINWIQKGPEIEGEANGDRSYVVSMPDENTVAVGASFRDANGVDSGYVRIFEWNGNNWTQKGQSITGEAASDFSGGAISMPDTNTIAVGAVGNDGTTGVDSGHARVFEWNGSNWIQKGLDIDGEDAFDESGVAVSMPDVNTVAIGAIGIFSNNNKPGQVRVYEWNGSNWIQKGQDIDGETDNSNFGTSVSMPDSNTLSVGAKFDNTNNGQGSGSVKVFSIENLGVNDSNFDYPITLYPNPAYQEATINLGTFYEIISLTLTNALGQTIVQKQYTNTDSISLKLNQEEGIYFVTISTESKQKTLKLIVSKN